MDMFGDDEEEPDNSSSLDYRPATCGVLSFHSGTEEAMFLHLRRTTSPGVHNVGLILKAIDDFCVRRHWMMHVGPNKAAIVCKELESLLSSKCATDQLFIVEIGSYCGYSSVSFCSYFVGRFPNLKMVCIEGDPQCVNWTRELVAYCGLSSMITVIEATVTRDLSARVLAQFSRRIDVLFIDHDKARYREDLVVLEESEDSLIQAGSIVVADNVLSFGKPLDDYLAHVRDPAKYSKSTLYESFVEYADSEEPEFQDGVEISIKC